MNIFYQKYRPGKIKELDSTSVRQALSRILGQKNLPHAFLFAGPKGTGKTSAARVLARSLNCPFAKKGDPCGKCDICVEISRGGSLDVLEIDAASNRGIDDIRNLKDKINLQPIKAKNKVYIIDEVHMLTREAFNAILKTLEEPPAHVYFIFCTTNPEKIPPTVLSRLTRIEFRRASEKEIRRALQRVVEGEKIKVEEKVLAMVAQVADGSFRDAHKILYQLWLSGKGKITAALAEEVLGRWQESDPEHLLRLMKEEKLKEALLLLENLNERGVNWQDYGQRLARRLKEKLLARVQEKGAEAKELKHIVTLSKIFQEAILQAKNSPLPQLPFQLAVVEYFAQETPQPQEKKATSPPASSSSVSASAVSASLPQGKSGVVDLTAVEKKWNELLALVKPMNHSVCALLRACRPKSVQGKSLVLEVFYQFHKDQLEQERNRRIVEEALAKLFRCSLRLECQLGSRPTPTPPPSSPPVAAKEVVTSKIADNQTAGNSDDDLYQIAKEIFGE